VDGRQQYVMTEQRFRRLATVYAFDTLRTWFARLG
jgi:hypothetical protein